MVVLKGGRIVIATMAIRPWEHVIPVYYSDDQGKSWVKTQTIVMEGSKINDHDGAMEPKLVELADHSIFMLIRTTKGTFYKSISNDGGLTWSKPETTGIQNNNSFGELARLYDGRLVLVSQAGSRPSPWWYPQSVRRCRRRRRCHRQQGPSGLPPATTDMVRAALRGP